MRVQRRLPDRLLSSASALSACVIETSDSTMYSALRDPSGCAQNCALIHTASKIAHVHAYALSWVVEESGPGERKRRRALRRGAPGGWLLLVMRDMMPRQGARVSAGACAGGRGGSA
ncbi:hypothetical protein BGM09_17070 [Streptomyces sp. CBMA29]|nr:hypothetical protein [Streptomyces sp. CBMA29]